jgi:hypothetical protein
VTDDDEPVGTIRKVQSVFWLGDWVFHRCEQSPDGPRRGLILAVIFIAGGGVRYNCQWSPTESGVYDEIELEPAGPGA